MKYANRYDVTVLVNGLPMVHIELKRRGVDHLTLDASTAPGGAWLQSWDTLTVESLNSIFGLPLSVPRLSPRRRKLPPRSPPISRTSSGACF